MKIKVKGLLKGIGLVNFEFEGDEEGIKEISKETAKMLNEIQRIDEGTGYLDYCKRGVEKIDKYCDAALKRRIELENELKKYKKVEDDVEELLPF